MEYLTNFVNCISHDCSAGSADEGKVMAKVLQYIKSPAKEAMQVVLLMQWIKLTRNVFITCLYQYRLFILKITTKLTLYYCLLSLNKFVS